jgi:hypothetical protein
MKCCCHKLAKFRVFVHISVSSATVQSHITILDSICLLINATFRLSELTPTSANAAARHKAIIPVPGILKSRPARKT